MKSTSVISTIIAIVVVLGLVWYIMSRDTTDKLVPPLQETTQEQAEQGTENTEKVSVAVPVSEPQKSFVVHGNDETADIKTITIPAGTVVTLTFSVDDDTTYRTGLEFRSDVVSTGTILPGQSKMVSFTAAKSFSFTPYRAGTDNVKPYTIAVVVK